MQKFIPLLCLALLSIFVTSCEDDDNGNGAIPSRAQCTLKSEFFQSGENITPIHTYAFDAQGRPLANATFNYSYPSQNEVVVEHPLAGYTITYTLGANGYPESAFQVPAPETVNDTSFYSYTYDSNNRITELEITQGLVIGLVSSDILVSYTYQNENLTNWKMEIIDPPTPQFSFDYTYGDDEMLLPLNSGFFENREGALDYVPGLDLFGTPIRNLPVTRTEGNEVKTYEYEFDDDGYVTHFTSFINGTKQEEIWYDYNCP